MVRYLLLHVKIEESVTQGLILDLLGPELVTKLLPHLLRHQLGGYELLRLNKLLLKLHLQAHVVL